MADAFALKAAAWDANPVRAAAGQAFYQEVLRTAPNLAGLHVLEFGCGTGVLGLHLAIEHQARLLFVDTSPAMLAVLRGKITELGLADTQVLEGDIAVLPVPEASVDLVVTLMALHHVADLPGALRPLRQALKPGGLLLLGDLLPEDGSFHGAEPVPHNGFTPADLGQTLAGCGLAVLDQRTFHTLRKPDAAGALHEYSLFCITAMAV